MSCMMAICMAVDKEVPFNERENSKGRQMEGKRRKRRRREGAAKRRELRGNMSSNVTTTSSLFGASDLLGTSS